MTDIFGEEVISGAVSLVRYSQIIGYTECAFFGVSHPSNIQYACREIWTKKQRDDAQYYLSEAQDEIEEILGYFLKPRWTTDEQSGLNFPAITKWGKLISAGVQKEEVISNGAAVSLATDPCTITIATASVPSDLSEVHVFYPGTDQEITVKNITYAGGNLVITIPKCRLVDYLLQDNPPEGLDYSDNANFQDTVDVHWIHNDDSVQAKFVYFNSDNCTSFCLTDYDSGCIRIEDAEIGKVGIHSNSSSCCRNYSHSLLNYYSGLTKLTRQAEMTIVRLAHTKMPSEPCGCDIVKSMWRRDNTTPQILTAERLNCPFGLSDGAWIAWKWACGMALVRMSALIGPYHGFPY
jgi:hypothetical protein